MCADAKFCMEVKFCLEIEFCVKVLRIFCVEEFQVEFESYVSLFITMVSHEDNLFKSLKTLYVTDHLK